MPGDTGTAPASGGWVGQGSTSIVPPADYWPSLERTLPGPQVRRLQELSDRRAAEFVAGDLPPPEHDALGVLDRVADDGWLERQVRRRCPNCSHQLTEAEAAGTTCPECGAAWVDHGGVVEERVYVRHLAPARSVDWVIALHGMNTRGAWQESFSWHVATTWGRSVPVAIYKYGIVIAGVIMAWRRHTLKRNLRAKIAALRDQARARGYTGNPDVIAHSFGTWLLGHLLEAELDRGEQERLRFGRVILTGCVLRPDFDWGRIRAAGLVEDVLNHYGTGDRVVPWAHLTITDSGPSGRRGFDGDQVANVKAAGYGHSDLFAVERCVVDGVSHRPCRGAAGDVRHLEHSYHRYWHPFLTLPRKELHRLPDLEDPATPWRALPWPLRGTLFPFVALPMVVALLALLVGAVGPGVQALRQGAAWIAGVGGAGVGLLLLGAAVIAGWRRVRGRGGSG